MTRIELEIKGLAELMRKFQNAPRELNKHLNKAMDKSILYIQQKLPPYPAPPENSTYRRTMTLGRSLTARRGQQTGAIAEVKSLAGEVRGVVGTAIPYAQYVIGKGRQARIHRGRWWVFEDEVEGAIPGVIKIFEAEIDQFLKE